MTVVVVGDLQAIRPGIEALQLGPIEVRNVEGRPLSDQRPATSDQ
jgi:hypothetical protein